MKKMVRIPAEHIWHDFPARIR